MKKEEGGSRFRRFLEEGRKRRDGSMLGNDNIVREEVEMLMKNEEGLSFNIGR